MIRIDKENYPAWALDYIEGSLAESQKKTFKRFLDEHPDIAREVAAMKADMPALPVPSQIQYPDKEILLQIAHTSAPNLCAPPVRKKPPRRERIISYVSGGVAAAVMVGLFAWFTGIDGVQDAGETAKVIEAQKQPVITHQPTHVEEPPKNLIAEDRSLEKTPREEKEIKISQKNIETVASTPPVQTKTIVQAKEVEAVKQVEVKEYFDLPPVEVEGLSTDYLAEESKSGTEVGKTTETNEDFIASSSVESDQISDTPPAEHYAMGDYVEPDRLWDQEGGVHSRNEGRFAAALRRGASRLLVPLDLLPVEKVATNDEKGIEIASMIRITKKIQND